MQELDFAALEADGSDARDAMDVGETAVRVDLAGCTVGSCGEFGARFYTTRHDRRGDPKGWLYTRCPDHYSKYEAKRA